MKIVFNPDVGPQGQSGAIPIGLTRYFITSSGTPVMPGSGVNQYLPPNHASGVAFEVDVPDGYGYQMYVTLGGAKVTSDIFTDDTEITFALFTGDLSTD